MDHTAMSLLRFITPYATGTKKHARCGLAMLEMVLALPILLLVMALMINYGVVASWKVRALVAARHAVWSSRPPRTPNVFPPPVGSIGIAEIMTDGPDYVQDLDPPLLHHPVVRGPLPSGNRVNAELLNCNRGLQSSEAIVERDFPLLSKMGPYHLQARTEVLGDTWQYTEMGLRHNGERRIPVIYDLAEAPAFLRDAYIRAVAAAADPNLQWALRCLDHDDEFIGYGRRFANSRIMTWNDTPPDFHPTLGALCSLAPGLVQQRVDDLVRRINDVPKNLARGFKALYERVIQELQWRIGNDPSLDPGQAAAYMNEIVHLQNQIQILDAFLQTLP